MSRLIPAAASEFERGGLSSQEIRRILLYGFKSAFCPYEARRRILLEAKEELHHLGLGWGAYT